MTVRITFLDKEGQPFAMLFGDSYKHWYDQVREYILTQISWADEQTLLKSELSGILRVETAPQRWLSGGVKWCPVEALQNNLDREAIYPQSPRRADSFLFGIDKRVQQIVEMQYAMCMRKLYWGSIQLGKMTAPAHLSTIDGATLCIKQLEVASIAWQSGDGFKTCRQCIRLQHRYLP